jgi:hypothetical protein
MEDVRKENERLKKEVEHLRGTLENLLAQLCLNPKFCSQCFFDRPSDCLSVMEDSCES